MHTGIRKRSFRPLHGGNQHLRGPGADRVLRSDRRLHIEKVLRVLLPGTTLLQILDRRPQSRQSDMVAVGHHARGHTVPFAGQSDLEFR